MALRWYAEHHARRLLSLPHKRSLFRIQAQIRSAKVVSHSG
jgi:hypothetical protein